MFVQTLFLTADNSSAFPLKKISPAPMAVRKHFMGAKVNYNTCFLLGFGLHWLCLQASLVIFTSFTCCVYTLLLYLRAVRPFSLRLNRLLLL